MEDHLNEYRKSLRAFVNATANNESKKAKNTTVLWIQISEL